MALRTVVTSLGSLTGDSRAQGGGGGPERPGDVRYIRNPQFSELAWEGENVIALGNGEYWGHPKGSASGNQWINWINANARTPGATQSAYLSSLNGDWGANGWARFDQNQGDSHWV